MHLSGLLSSSLLILGAACAPVEPEVTMSVSTIGHLLSSFRHSPRDQTSCSISAETLPVTGSGSQLPDPSGMTLKYITLGIGTQNYTCANNDETTKPALLGALANIYDVSCLVTKNSRLLDFFAKMAVKLPAKMVNDMITKHLGLSVLGKHYFSGSVPLFDLRRDSRTDYAYVSVAAKIPAPATEDVDWLKLNAVDGSGIKVRF